MLQVITRQFGIPIYGFGMMLFIAFILCTWLAGRRGEREGIKKETIQDLAIWIFIGGLLGARITFLLQEDPQLNLKQFILRLPRIWDGGIILYGSILGGLAGYALAWVLIFRKQGLHTRRLADVVAPSIALGLCLGRMGCFLNGCCYGQVACQECAVYPVSFPMSAPPRELLVDQGYQTAAGFTVSATRPTDTPAAAETRKLLKTKIAVDFKNTPLAKVKEELQDAVKGLKIMLDTAGGVSADQPITYQADDKSAEQILDELGLPYIVIARRGKSYDGYVQICTGSKHGVGDNVVVGLVDPGSRAYEAGLRPGAVIFTVNDHPILQTSDLNACFALGSGEKNWPRGQSELKMEYEPKPDADPVTMTIKPRTLGLYPTQLYEVVSMFLLFLVLLAYEPFRHNPGQVAAVLMVGYGIHRYLNEILRGDPRPESFERYGSFVCVALGVALWIWLWRKEPDPPVKPVADTAIPSESPAPA